MNIDLHMISVEEILSNEMESRKRVMFVEMGHFGKSTAQDKKIKMLNRILWAFQRKWVVIISNSSGSMWSLDTKSQEESVLCDSILNECVRVESRNFTEAECKEFCSQYKIDELAVQLCERNPIEDSEL